MKEAIVYVLLALLTGCAGLQQEAATQAERVDAVLLGSSAATFKGCINYQCNLVRVDVLRSFTRGDPRIEEAFSVICTQQGAVKIPRNE